MQVTNHNSFYMPFMFIWNKRRLQKYSKNDTWQLQKCVMNVNKCLSCKTQHCKHYSKHLYICVPQRKKMSEWVVTKRGQEHYAIFICWPITIIFYSTLFLKECICGLGIVCIGNSIKEPTVLNMDKKLISFRHIKVPETCCSYKSFISSDRWS